MKANEFGGHAELINGAIVYVKPGETLTAEEKKALANYIEFCRKIAARKKKLKQIKLLRPLDG